MAIELKYKVTVNEDRLGIDFVDETGAYSSGNIGGWGAPNAAIASVTGVFISITKRGGTTYNIDPSPSLPTVDTAYEYAIAATEFGFAAGVKITDGLYQVAYTVEYVDSLGNSQTAYDSFYFSFTKGLECCISNIREALEVPSGACECDDEAITSLSNAETLLNLQRTNYRKIL